MRAYLDRHIDVAQAEVNPFQHYLVDGTAGSARDLQERGGGRNASPAQRVADPVSPPLAPLPDRPAETLPTLASVGLTETDLIDVAEYFDEDY